MKGIEKRQFVRVLYNTPVEIILEDGKKIKTRCDNLSVSGMGVFSDVLIKTNTDIQLKFSVDYDENSYEIKPEGKIIWTFGDDEFYRLGIQFTKYPNKDRTLLQEFVSYKFNLLHERNPIK